MKIYLTLKLKRFTINKNKFLPDTSGEFDNISVFTSGLKQNRLEYLHFIKEKL